MNPELIEKNPVNAALVKSELESINKRDGELSFRGGRTLEYLQEFVSLKKKDATEIEKKLNDLGISRLKDEFIHKLIDVMPKSVDEMKVALQGYTLSLSKADMEKVMGVLKDYLPKK